MTLLVEENGSGKSTIVEAVAMLFGLSPEGGTRQGMHPTRASESALADALRMRRGSGQAHLEAPGRYLRHVLD